MLIAFEGIDGAGKTTAAASLCACLQGEGVDARSIAKSSIDCDDPQARAVLATLRELIWQPAGFEPSRDVLGTHYYVYLNAAWYAAFDRCREAARQWPDGVVCVDGWYYRAIVKAHLRSGLDIGWLETLFGHIRPPDAVVLLDIDPALAWRRRKTFKPTELGRWDGYAGEAFSAFCACQGQIRTCPLAYAYVLGWHVIEQTEDAVVGNIVERVRATVLKSKVVGCRG